jgi:hypothetical protein
MFTIKSEEYNNTSKTIQLHFEISIIPYKEFTKFTLLIYDEKNCNHELISYGVDTIETFFNRINEFEKFKKWIDEITSKFYTIDKCEFIFFTLIHFFSSCKKYFNLKIN